MKTKLVPAFLINPRTGRWVENLAPTLFPALWAHCLGCRNVRLCAGAN